MSKKVSYKTSNEVSLFSDGRRVGEKEKFPKMATHRPTGNRKSPRVRFYPSKNCYNFQKVSIGRGKQKSWGGSWSETRPDTIHFEGYAQTQYRFCRLRLDTFPILWATLKHNIAFVWLRWQTLTTLIFLLFIWVLNLKIFKKVMISFWYGSIYELSNGVALR